MRAPWEDENARRWEEWRINQEAALRAHGLFHQSSADMFGSVISFGVEAIRTAALINGGASVASIAFVGSAFERDSALASSLSFVVLIFVAGVLFAGLSSGFAYLSQYLYERAHRRANLTFEHPYVVWRADSRIWDRAGMTLHVLCVISVIGSYIALAVGACWIWAIIN